MWDILSLVDSKGLSLSSAPWVSCMRLPSGRITCGPCEVLTLLLQGVSNLVWFCVAPMSSFPYVGLLFGRLPLQFL